MLATTLMLGGGALATAQDLVKVEQPWILSDAAWDTSSGEAPVAQWVDKLPNMPEAEVKEVVNQVIARWKYLRAWWEKNEGQKTSGATYTELKRIQSFAEVFASTGAMPMDGVRDNFDGTYTIVPESLMFYVKGMIALVGHSSGEWSFVNMFGQSAYLDDAATLIACRASLDECKARQRYLCYPEIKEIINDKAVSRSNTPDDYALLADLQKYYIEGLENALDKNSPDVIPRKPRPAAGALHAQYHDAALKASREWLGKVKDVIITADNYDYRYDIFGFVEKRVFEGYVVTEEKYGDYVSYVIWAQDAIGDGQFGDRVYHYAVGLTAGHYLPK